MDFSVISIRKLPPDKCSNKLVISFQAFLLQNEPENKWNQRNIENMMKEVALKRVYLVHLVSDVIKNEKQDGIIIK